MNSDTWAELTEDERDKFFIARKKLTNDGTIDQNEATSKDTPSKDTTTKTSSDEQIIANLRMELKKLEKINETKPISTIANITSDMTVNQAISGLSRINQTKVHVYHLTTCCTFVALLLSNISSKNQNRFFLENGFNSFVM